MKRLQSGKVGELAAERWFAENGWKMIRTQPPVTILGMVSQPMIGVLKRFIPRLAAFGHIVIARMGKGGVPDYTGYQAKIQRGSYVDDNGTAYRAVEVKEAKGDSMHASRLDKAQREFMSCLPHESAWVGIWWEDHQQFTMHLFSNERGSYKHH